MKQVSMHNEYVTFFNPICEGVNPGSFAPGRKDPGFVLKYL